MFKSLPSVQLVPLYSSLSSFKAGDAGPPPKAKPAVCVPAPPILYRAVPKLFCSDQAAPFHSSVSAVAGAVDPPKIKAVFIHVPAPAAECLPVFITFVSHQLLPL